MAKVSTISDIHNPWRDALMPAHFASQLFHVESGGRESGRRIVVHEFPKRDLPYSEDMGRQAISFTVRGYCISFPRDASRPLYMRDYRIARDALQGRLETGDPGELQLPTMKPLTVVCQRYRLVEEERFGGYCVFDMTFVEWGLKPGAVPQSTESVLLQASQSLKDQIIQDLTAQRLR